MSGSGQILTATVDNFQFDIDIRSLPSGIYLINILTDHGILTGKFMKK
jgi:hypothetical protein